MCQSLPRKTRPKSDFPSRAAGKLSFLWEEILSIEYRLESMFMGSCRVGQIPSVTQTFSVSTSIHGRLEKLKLSSILND